MSADDASQMTPAPKAQVIKTHWLYGFGKNNEISFAVDVATAADETQCTKCAHQKVCARVMLERCANYDFGSSEQGCRGCIHHYTRFDHRQPIPCFHCADFMPMPESIEENHV
jgi:hypothetical protein